MNLKRENRALRWFTFIALRAVPLVILLGLHGVWRWVAAGLLAASIVVDGVVWWRARRTFGKDGTERASR